MSNNIYQEITPTYLYIKYHSETGLKYFGKTTKVPGTKSFENYLGSGKKWINHIRKHGKQFVFNELIIGPYTDKFELSNLALWLSTELDVVKDNNWANLIPENGLDGGAGSVKGRNKGQRAWNKGKKYSEEELINYKFNFSKQKTENHKQSISKSLKGFYASSEGADKKLHLSECVKGENHHNFGKIWIHNPTLKQSKYITKSLPIPLGWLKGRLPK